MRTIQRSQNSSSNNRSCWNHATPWHNMLYCIWTMCFFWIHASNMSWHRCWILSVYWGTAVDSGLRKPYFVLWVRISASFRQVKLEVNAVVLTGDPKSNLSSLLPVTHPKLHSGVRGERQRKWEAGSSDRVSVYLHFLLLCSWAEPQFSLLKKIQFSSVHQGRHG